MLRLWIILFGFSTACGYSAGDEQKLDLIGKSNKSHGEGAESPGSFSHETLSQGLHQRFFVVDLIQDLVFRKRLDGADLNSKNAHVNVKRLREGGFDFVLAALPATPGVRAWRGLEKALDSMEAIVAATNGAVLIASGLAEARQMAKRGVLPMMLLLEGADALDGRLDDLQVLKRRGLLVVGLTSRRGNVFAEAATFPREIGGLTKKGRALLEACRDHGLIVDLTHASTRSFWDVLSAQLSTVIVSHTATKALRDHPRNLDDLQILALSRYKGLMGLSFNPDFLKSGDSRATIDDVVRHVLHIKSLGAVDALALGTDFGGIFPPLGLEHAGRLSRLTEALARQGLSDGEIAGIMGENAMRVFTESTKNRGMMELPMGDVLRPVPMECDSVTGEKDGEAELACDGFITEHGATLSPASRQRFRIQDKSREPISLELWGDPGIPWQVEAQNLSGKVLFHRMVQLDEQGNGSVFLPSGRDLTRLFCSPTRPASLKEVVIWGR